MPSPYLPVWLRNALEDARRQLDTVERLAFSHDRHELAQASEAAERLATTAVRILHFAAAVSERAAYVAGGRDAQTPKEAKQ